MDWDGWLSKVFGPGQLDKYRSKLEDNFDSVEQISDLYVSEDAKGKKVLDEQFFDDVGVQHSKDRELFKSWLTRNGEADREQSASLSGDQWPSIEKWLRHVDPTGSLNQYLDDLVENFDSVAQIIELYVTPQGSGGDLRLDPQFFEDASIEDSGHRALFGVWFARQAGARPARMAMPTIAEEKRLAPTSNAGAAECNELRAMLDAIDWSTGALTKYQQKLEAQFDHPGQIIELYVSVDTTGKRILDAQFYKDVGVTDTNDRALFEAWFSGKLASAPETKVNGVATDVDIREWLEQHDWAVGILEGYRESLEENFDSPDQVAELYVSKGPDGKPTFDPQFFEDAGVNDPAHRKLFEFFFLKQHQA